MRIIPVHAAGNVDGDIIARVRRTAGRLPTLADVLAWGRAQTPPCQVTEIVTQDEYTHDVVVPLGSAHYLAFDTT